MSDLPSPEKERQILDGAATIFAQDGYEGASMARIACASGVSKGTLYNYFNSKADLFAVHISQQCRKTLCHVFEDLAQEADPAKMLYGVGLRMLQVLFSPAGLTIYRMVVAEAAKFPELARAFYDAGPQVALAHLSGWLKKQNEIGRLHVADPLLAAEQFFSLCRARYGLKRELQLLSDPPQEELEAIVTAAVQVFMNTYGPTANPLTTSP